MRAITVFIGALATIVLSQEAPCIFDLERIKACNNASLLLDNIADLEKYLMDDDTIDSFTAAVTKALETANGDTKNLLTILQERLSTFNDAADNKNYDVVDKMKLTTDDMIISDDDLLNRLKTLNETNSIALVPCSVSDIATNITTTFKQDALISYQNTKLALVPNMDEINLKVAELTEALKTDANSNNKQIEKLTNQLKDATDFINSKSDAIDTFATEIVAHATIAEKGFQALAETVNAIHA